MRATIYRVLNTLNSKSYVSSTKWIDTRWTGKKGHKTKLDKKRHPNIHLQAEYCIHGTDRFRFEVLEETEHPLIAKRRWRKELKSAVPLRGYNQTYTEQYGGELVAEEILWIEHREILPEYIKSHLWNQWWTKGGLCTETPDYEACCNVQRFVDSNKKFIGKLKVGSYSKLWNEYEPKDVTAFQFVQLLGCMGYLRYESRELALRTPVPPEPVRIDKTLKLFFDERLQLDPDAELPKPAARAACAEWCRINGLQPPPPQQFGVELRKWAGGSISATNLRYIGLKFLNEQKLESIRSSEGRSDA